MVAQVLIRQGLPVALTVAEERATICDGKMSGSFYSGGMCFRVEFVSGMASFEKSFT